MINIYEQIAPYKKWVHVCITAVQEGFPHLTVQDIVDPRRKLFGENLDWVSFFASLISNSLLVGCLQGGDRYGEELLFLSVPHNTAEKFSDKQTDAANVLELFLLRAECSNIYQLPPTYEAFSRTGGNS